MTTNFFHPSLLLLVLDPGSGMGKNQDPGSGINIPVPQHCQNIRKDPTDPALDLAHCYVQQLLSIYPRVTHVNRKKTKDFSTQGRSNSCSR
jgi:hypothetical protein